MCEKHKKKLECSLKKVYTNIKAIKKKKKIQLKTYVKELATDLGLVSRLAKICKKFK